MIDEEFLSNLESLCSHFVEREKRAKQRLEAGVDAGWYFGVLGLGLESPPISVLGGEITLSEVLEPPGEIELARALADKGLLSSVARYSQGICCELKIGSRFGDFEAAANVAWWMFSLLRVRVLTDFLVPVSADVSWSVVSGVEKDSCRVRLIEDFPRAHVFGGKSVVGFEDLSWASENLIRFSSLLDVPCFRLAVEALTTCGHQSSERMSAAILWSGLEALFDISSEIRFRLAAYVSVVVEVPGEKRLEMYKEVKKLYDVRSKAVHGGKVSSEQIFSHIVRVRYILSKVVQRFIEEGEVFSVERIEREMLAG